MKRKKLLDDGLKVAITSWDMRTFGHHSLSYRNTIKGTVYFWHVQSSPLKPKVLFGEIFPFIKISARMILRGKEEVEFCQWETVALAKTHPWQLAMRPPHAVLSVNGILQVTGVLGSSTEQRLQWEHMIDYMIVVDLRLCAKLTRGFGRDSRPRVTKYLCTN